ncbi:MAG TPA: adenylate/guanylate cyclase domain-containing protein [Candidatus Limnocylindria bacterium]|jgi:adenylate cyclase|nr:adenylate/guanylate cyclase domain-containing protein [Candidatus Limnocylindria bacterium]
MPEKARSLEEEWRTRLLGTNPGLRAGRRFFLRLPSSPRCELCASPFRAPFGPVMKLIGHGPWERNPRYCKACCSELIRHKAGAEIPLSFLFADVRGSTPLGERLGARALHDLLDRFYATGVDALIAHGALIDRFMGDQVVGYFVPGFAGARHAGQAVACGLEILRATGHGDETPWVPVGAGVHTGEAFVGAVGKEDDMAELTAIGDAVTIAARLASVAGIGELLVSEEAFAAAGLGGDPERRELSLKGVTGTVPVRILRLQETARASV